MIKIKKTKAISIAAVMLFLIVIPAITRSPYHMHILITILLYIMITASFRFCIIDGDWPFAHVPLMGLGGYTSALLVMRLGWPFWPAFFTGGIVAVIAGLIIYIPCVRTRGITFFWITWAFGEVLRQTFIRFREPFGGASGLVGIPGPVISIPGLFKVEFLSQVSYYYLALVLALLTIVVLYKLENSRIGLTLKSIGENTDLAESTGINVTRQRLLALTIASFIAGIGGSFYAHWIHLLTPVEFDVAFGLFVLLYAVVGGTATWWGPVVGVTVFVVLAQFLRGFTIYIPAVYGFILILTLAFLPEGLESLHRRILSLIEKDI
jgi:branched-chain amino acid transport system permease protein